MLPPPQHQSLRGGSTTSLLRVLASRVRIGPAFPTGSALAPSPTLHECVGVWDTGATNSVVTQAVVDACGLVSHTFKRVHTAKGTVDNVPAYMIDMHLPPSMRFPDLEVTLGELVGTDVLIGMDVIGCGDFAVTNFKGSTLFSFRTPSVATIDFVKQTHAGNAVPKMMPPVRKKGKKR